MAATSLRGSGIEGIGRPRVEPSFVPKVIDRMMRVLDKNGQELFREEKLADANDVVVNAGKKNVWIKNVSVDTTPVRKPRAPST